MKYELDKRTIKDLVDFGAGYTADLVDTGLIVNNQDIEKDFIINLKYNYLKKVINNNSEIMFMTKYIDEDVLKNYKRNTVEFKVIPIWYRDACYIKYKDNRAVEVWEGFILDNRLSSIDNRNGIRRIIFHNALLKIKVKDIFRIKLNNFKNNINIINKFLENRNMSMDSFKKQLLLGDQYILVFDKEKVKYDEEVRPMDITTPCVKYDKFNLDYYDYKKGIKKLKRAHSLHMRVEALHFLYRFSDNFIEDLRRKKEDIISRMTPSLNT